MKETARKFKRGGRRALAVFLSALMLMTAWVFVAPDALPKASAMTSQSAGSYYIRVIVHDTDKATKDSCNNSAGYLVVPTRKQDGTDGTTWSATVTAGQWDTDGGTWTYTGSAVNGFPKHLRKVQTNSATATNWIKNKNKYRNSIINFKVQVSSDNSNWTTVIDYDEETSNGGNWSYTNGTSESQYPKLNSVGISGSDTLTQNGTGTTATYSVSSAKDQYGVNWGFSGVTWTTSNTGMASIDNNGNATFKGSTSQYQTIMYPTLGGTQKGSKTVTVNFSALAISPDTDYTVTIANSGEAAWFTYTPTSTAKYVVFSHASSGDPLYYCYKGDMSTSFNNNDDCDPIYQKLLGLTNRMFCQELELQANTKYYFKCGFWSTNTGSFPFRIGTGVTVNFHATGGTDQSYILPKGYDTMYLSASATGVSRSGHNLIAWSTSSNARQTKSYMASVTTSVPTSGQTYYALWYPNNPTAVTQWNTDYTATISQYSVEFYSLTPDRDRRYKIYSSASFDTYGLLLKDSDWSSSASIFGYDDDSGGDSQFLMEQDLSQGVKYLIGVKAYGGGTGNVNFRVLPRYIIEYNLNGGDGTTPDTQYRYHGDSAIPLSSVAPTTYPSPAAAYDNFLGWDTNSAATTATYAPGATYDANSDALLYAIYHAKDFTITYNVDGGDSISAKTYNIRSTDTLPKPTKTGYTFDGWKVTTAGGNWTANAIVNNGTSLSGKYGNVTLTAQWTINTSKLTVKPNGGTWDGFTTDQDYTQNYNTTKTIADPTAPAGKHFTGWTLSSGANGSFSGGTYTFGPTKNANDTLTAGYANHTYGTATYTWSDDGKTCTASHTCTYASCGHVESETATVANGKITVAKKTDPTCTVKGWNTYTATFTTTGFNQQTKDVQDIAATGHTYNTPADSDWTWTPSGDTYTVTVTVTCEKGDDTQTLTATVGDPAVAPATHLVNGSKTFTATATIGSQTFTATKTDIIYAEGHQWDYTSDDVTYSWADDYTSCTATVPCSVCGDTTTVTTTNISSNVTTQAKCNVEGIETYVATFEQTGLGDSKDKNLGYGDHKLGELTPAAPASNCLNTGLVAYYTCEYCGTHFAEDRITALTSLDDGTPGPHATAPVAAVGGADCQHYGTIAHFECSNCHHTFSDAAAEDEITDLCDYTYGPHTWNFVSFAWAADNTNAKVNLICDLDNTHTTQVDAEMSHVDYPARCEADAYTVYTATYEAQSAQATVTHTGTALPHIWNFVSFEWAADGKTAKVNLKCSRDESHTSQVDAEMSSVFHEAVCEQDAYTVYTATYGDNHEDNTVTDEGTALDHIWVFDSFEWAADGKTAKVNLKCSRNEEHTSQVDAEMSSVFHEAVCEQDAYTVYTATYGDNHEDNTVTDEGTALEHIWVFDSFEWAANGKTAKVNLKCSRDEEHTTQVDAEMSSVFYEAACEQDAYTVYTANYGDNHEDNTVPDEGTALPHIWVYDSFEWAADGKTAKVNLKCSRDESHTSQVDAEMSSVFHEAVCEHDAYTVYTATYGDKHEDNIVKNENSALEHIWNFVSFEWAADGKTAKVNLKCSRDESHTSQVDAEMSSVFHEAVCEQDAYTVYTATYGDHHEDNTVTDESTALEHIWGFDSFEWAADGTSAKVNLVCDRNAEHTSQIDAQMSSVFHEAGCDQDAYTVYTATYGDHHEDNTVTDDGTALVHDWKFESFTWADDNRSATVNLVCDHNNEHTKTVDAEMSFEHHVATCTEDGYTLYTATYAAENKTESRTVAGEGRLGHRYEFSKFVWSEDGSTAEALYICQNDEAHTDLRAAEMSQVDFPATCEDAPRTIYTATYDGHTEDKDVITGDPLGHDWNAWVVTKGATCLETGSKYHVCKRDESHVETVTIPLGDHVDGNHDDLCDVCGADMLSHHHTDSNYDNICDKCGQTIDTGFRCSMCNQNDQIQATGNPVVKFFYMCIHMFVHAFQSFTYHFG